MIPLYYSARSLWARRIATGLTVGGLSLVVFVFAAVLMLSHGIEQALASGGSPENVVLLREGSTNEVVSSIERDAVQVASTWPEVATGPSGQPLAVGEVVVLVALPRAAGGFVNVAARGIGEGSFEARPGVHLVEGRRPRPGTDEVALGTGLIGRTTGAYVGGQLSFAQQQWPVVGRLGAAGSAFESEMWVDRERLADAFHRTGFSSAIVRLASTAQVPTVAARARGDPRLALKAEREDQYWADQAIAMATFIRVLGLFVSFVFGIGAVLGAMITLYAQVAARVRELGVMRALGFRRRSVLGAVVVESLLLGTASGILGDAGAYLMRWVQIRTLNFQTFSEVRFGFEPTPRILLAALGFGAAMGLLGGLLPALRAARLSPLEAIRA